MNSVRSAIACVVLLAGTAIFGTAAAAQSTGLEDLVGARAGQAENAVTQRGYRLIRAQPSDDRTYTFWWNAARRQCVTIATMDGRYSSITATPAPDCGQSASSRPRPSYAPAQPPMPGYEVDPGYSQRPPYYTGDPALVDGRNVELGLVCFGDGSRAGIASGTQWRWNSRRDRYESEVYNQTTRQNFDATLTLQIYGDSGRIRLPRSLVPPINSRGDNGWWELRDVRAGRDIITANYRLNGLNKPRITIDRRTGRITIQGTAPYGFRGSCDEIGHGNRRF